MFSLIFAESALETIPDSIMHHSCVVAHAQKLRKKPHEILLDNSWHYAAMKKIKNQIKRGRPDIIHFSLLEATTIPLYRANKIKVYVHTIHNKVITLGANINLPKSYHRFQGLIEKLYQKTEIQSYDNTLLQLHDMTLSQLIQKINPKTVIGLSREKGSSMVSPATLVRKFDNDTCLIIGGFQKGHFSESTKSCIDTLYQIHQESLESHVVTSRILYEYEKTLFM